MLGLDGLEWPKTMDALAWAEMFCEENPGADLALMLAWFSTALMTGYATALRKVKKDAQSEQIV